MERPMTLEHMAGHLIRRLHQRSAQVFQRRVQAAGLDLTQVQFAALTAVQSDPGMDQAGVAAAIGYDRATIGGVIDRLEQKGYVTRTVSPTDRRARQVRLTKDGAAAIIAATPLVRDLQREILEALDPPEQARFEALARKALGLTGG
ncbi:MAG: DNA-binding MarR family transcriptional regulator [Paracoccaceae bacterium]|jgi:DNA-binding MarR family transcriptional regulator